MNSDENTERLAKAKLRMHEITEHEGVTESNAREYHECMLIEMRGGRDRA